MEKLAQKQAEADEEISEDVDGSIRPREDKVEAIRSTVFHRLTIRVFLYSEGVRS